MSEQPQDNNGPFASSQMNQVWRQEQEYKQRSEQPQEWTPENIGKVCGFVSKDCPNFYSSLGELIRRICDAHNDSLAAEREKARVLVKALEGIRHHAQGDNRKLCLGCSFSFNTATEALAKVKEAK